jgi:hypothetical protein
MRRRDRPSFPHLGAMSGLDDQGGLRASFAPPWIESGRNGRVQAHTIHIDTPHQLEVHEIRGNLGCGAARHGAGRDGPHNPITVTACREHQVVRVFEQDALPSRSAPAPSQQAGTRLSDPYSHWLAGWKPCLNTTPQDVA